MNPVTYTMLDLDGLDLASVKGQSYPGLYNSIYAAMNRCQEIILCNWFVADILIPPTYCLLNIDEYNVISINNKVFIYPDDTIEIPDMGTTPNILELSITQNGEYTAPEGVDGYNPVNVSVIPSIESISITENGIYEVPTGVDGYNPVEVNVIDWPPEFLELLVSENVKFEFGVSLMYKYLYNDFSKFDSQIPNVFNAKYQYSGSIDTTKSYSLYIVAKVISTAITRISGFSGVGEGQGLLPALYQNGSNVYTTYYGSDVNSGVSSRDYFVGCVIIDRVNNQARYAVNDYRETKSLTMRAWNTVSFNGQNLNYIGEIDVKYFALVEGADSSDVVNSNISILHDYFIGG